MATLVAPPVAPATYRLDVHIAVTGPAGRWPASDAVPDARTRGDRPARGPRPRLLVVEPDPSLRAAYASALATASEEVAAVDCLRAARAARPTSFDCVVLDRSAGDGDGEGDALALVDELYRAGGRTRVVVVSGRATESERIEGLARGADDYLAKTVGLPELVARVRRLTECRAPCAAPPIRIGRVEIDRDRRVARLDGREVDLTPTQYELLVELARQPGRVVRTRRLLERAWDDHRDLEPSVLRPHVTRLRKALRGSIEVRSVRGVGYVLDVVGATVAAGRALAADGSTQLTQRDGARAKTA